MSNRSELLCEIQKHDFMLYDLQLYLNSHPTCPEALRKYRECLEHKHKAEEAFIKQYGPICAEQSDTDKWNWTCNPWPWEKEAN